jgi:pSer/pThr/pTyr-binding forkhead associated (FHA) protein
VAPPRIDLHRDDDLRVGEFGIATATVSAPAEAPGAALAPSAAAPPLVAAAPGGALLDQTVLYQEQAVAVAAAPPAARPSTPRASVRGQQGEWELREAVTVIGRSRRCDIVLTDPNVSRQHAEIRRQDDGFMALDLGSTNGMRVNRRDVKQAVLQHGDRLELGTTELVFERLP